jgi:hypothetical protein
MNENQPAGPSSESTYSLKMVVG